MAGKRSRPAKRFVVEGNKGGSYVALEETDREDVVRLEVGVDCVHRIEEEVSVCVLAVVLARAKEIGFDKLVRDAYNGNPTPWLGGEEEEGGD